MKYIWLILGILSIPFHIAGMAKLCDALGLYGLSLGICIFAFFIYAVGYLAFFKD
jgi:hypothetical protein